MAKKGGIRDTKGAAMIRVAQFLSVQDKGIEDVSDDALTLIAVAINGKKKHLKEMLVNYLQSDKDLDEQEEEIETSTQIEQTSDAE